MKAIVLVGLLAMIGNNVAWSQAQCSGESCFERACHGDNCHQNVRSDAAMQTLHDLKSASANDPELSVPLLGAIATGVGVASIAGYTTYANYRQNMEVAQRTASLLREQGRVIARALEQAVAPELQRFTSALLQKNAANAARGAAALTAQEAEQLVLRGMQSPQVRERIIASLTRSFANSSASPVARQMAELAYHNVIRDSRGLIARQWNNVLRLSSQGIVQSARLGTTLLAPISERVLPFLTKTSAQRILAHLASNAGRGLLSSCAGWVRSLFRPRVAAGIGGGALTAAFILLDASPLAPGTLDAMYAANPALLLELPEREARRWIEQYPAVRNSLYALGELALQGGYSHAQVEEPICEFQEVQQEINECNLDQET